MRGLSPFGRLPVYKDRPLGLGFARESTIRYPLG